MTTARIGMGDGDGKLGETPNDLLGNSHLKMGGFNFAVVPALQERVHVRIRVRAGLSLRVIL
jgi:hypothetical protein